jgi:flagellar hook-associated protein 1 FlgK
VYDEFLARQVLLAEGGALAARFNNLQQRLDDLGNNVTTQLRTVVSEVNELAAGIADLNRDIILQAGQGDGRRPNDLLDRRDLLVARLAERVAVTTVEQDNGALNVFIGNGQPLVVNFTTQALSVTTNPYNSARAEIGFSAGGTPVIVTGQLNGGSLGGLLRMRDEVLDPAYNGLGRVAIGLAASFNAQHALGQDLDGNLGGAFFRAVDATAPAVLPDRANTGTGAVAAAVTGVAALTTSDYRLDYDGASYTVTRLNDGAVTTLTTFPGAAETVDGVTLTLGAGVIQAGDSYLIRPTHDAGAQFALALVHPRAIAAAAPIRTAAALANTGTGGVSAGVANSLDPNLQQPVTITFTSPTTFDVTGVGTGNPVGVAYTAGASISYNGWTITINGAPAAGDQFTVGPNTGGVADNRNAALLANLQTRYTLDNGTASFEGAYGQLVANTGVRTHQADVARESSLVVRDQAIAAHEAVSGVNLDEEAANMLRYQQAYQAAAQMIGVADTLFQTLLGAVRR